MSRPVTARIYLEGATRAVKLAEPSTEEIFKQFVDPGDYGVIQGVTVEGVQFATLQHRVIDILGPLPRDVADAAAADAGIFDGRMVRLRSYAAWRKEENRLWVEAGEDAGTAEVWAEYPFPAVVVLASDMAEAPVLVARGDGEVLWANPASPTGSVARYREVVRLACEAEGLQAAEYGDRLTTQEDDANGEAHLKAGNIKIALALLDPDYVAGYLAQAVKDRGDVQVVDGDYTGEISAYEGVDPPTAEGVFVVDAGLPGEWPARVLIGQIERVSY